VQTNELLDAKPRNPFFTSKGRDRRLSFILTQLVVGGVGSLIITFLNNWVVLQIPVVIIVSLTLLRSIVRRLHDLNRSEWWALLALVPIINVFMAIYLIFFKGTPGPNKYDIS
jgi:uncharacterized membrane protein YhaH (DUF805 family)